MTEIDYSTDAKIMLARMSFIYERETGRRVHLSNLAQLVDVINYAVSAVDRELQQCCRKLFALLSPAEVMDLVYRGAKVDRQWVEKASGHVAAGKTIHYRGVAVSTAEAGQDRDAPPSAKKQRMYRGRLVAN